MAESVRFDRRDLWDEISRLRDETDRRMRELLSLPGRASHARRIGLVPRADAYRTETHMVVRLALPGAIPENIDISIEERLLTVRGEITEPLDVEERSRNRLEIISGYFERTVTLPEEADEASMEARLSAGILDVRFRLR